jgi:hypothetical protein
VDAFGYYKYNPYWAPELEPLNSSDTEPTETDHLQSTARKGRRLSEEELKSNSALVKSRRQWLLLMDPFLPGFSFRENRWCQSITTHLRSRAANSSSDWLLIDHIHDVSWNTQAYEKLLIPDDRKDLLLTFVQNHAKMGEVSQDIIAGKGM